VSNNSLGVISEVDLTRDLMVRRVRVGKNPRTIALAPQTDALYVCNYSSNTLGVVDLTSWRQVASYPTRTHPIGVTVSPDGRQVWVSSYRTSTIHVFRTAAQGTQQVQTQPNAPKLGGMLAPLHHLVFQRIGFLVMALLLLFGIALLRLFMRR
jgi:YVTN family beta-propeller protein